MSENIDSKIKLTANRLSIKALKKGLIKRDVCKICKSSKNLRMHHENYFKPLEIIWLCQKHHMAIHSRIAFLKLGNKAMAIWSKTKFREARDEYIKNVCSQDLFDLEDILDMVKRRFGRSISRATFYRIIKNEK